MVTDNKETIMDETSVVQEFLRMPEVRVEPWLALGVPGFDVSHDGLPVGDIVRDEWDAGWIAAWPGGRRTFTDVVDAACWLLVGHSRAEIVEMRSVLDDLLV